MDVYLLQLIDRFDEAQPVVGVFASRRLARAYVRRQVKERGDRISGEWPWNCPGGPEEGIEYFIRRMPVQT